MCWRQANCSASGVQDVSGPGAAPIYFDPNLSASALADLQRSGWLPHAALTPQELVNARTLLAVGDWNGSATSLTSRPLFKGDFSYKKASFARALGGAGRLRDVRADRDKPSFPVVASHTSG